MQIYNTDYICESFASKKQVDKDAMKSLVNFIFEEAKKEILCYDHLRISLANFATFFYPLKRLIQLREELKVEIATPKSIYEKHLPFKNATKEELQNYLNKINKLIDEDYVVYKDNKAKRKRLYSGKHKENVQESTPSTPDGAGLF